MESTDFKDYVYGCIYGGAIGDALGYPVEFSSMATILEQYGPKGIQDLPDPALYTDDTQMTLRVARGLCLGYSGQDDYVIEEVDSAVADQLILWAREDPPRAPGASCLHGVSNLEKGCHRELSGKQGSKGCGAVMRSAPYGIVFSTPGSAAENAAHHTLMTHKHPAAQASAAGFAAGIYTILRKESYSITKVIDAMVDAAKKYDDRTAYMVQWAYALALDPKVQPSSVLEEWEGWTGDEALAAAVYCWTKNPEDYVAAIRMAVNSPGDSDSLGSITGNLSGAWLGISGIPLEWIESIENSSLISDVSQELIEAANR